MKQKIRKAVFPAAGLGTRFLPATKASPKEMLPLVDKPLIQYSVEEAVASGIESVLIVTGRAKTSIEDHFDIAFELEQNLKEKGKHEMFDVARKVSELTKIFYTRQKQALGLGHAIYQAKDFAENEPFAVLLADDVVDAEIPALKQMIDVYEKYQAPVIATMQVEGEAISRFGVIDAQEVEPNVFKIHDMVEKPKYENAPSDLAIIGRYILTPDIFEAIDKTERGAGGEIQITDAMRLLMQKRDFYAVKLQGTRHDAGDKLGFLIATVEFALKRDDLGGEFKKILEIFETLKAKYTGGKNMGGKTWDEWIAEYSKSHQNKINQITHQFGIPMIALSIFLIIPSFFIGGLWRIALLLFVAGWVLQFIGHYFEGKPPEFFKDWRFLFVGLRWWFAKISGKTK